MVRVITAGLDQYTGGPTAQDWYKTTSVTCPRCGCVFRLDEYDFEVNGPAVGHDLVQHYHWDKLSSNFGVLATTVTYPDAIQGNCPWCDYYPILVISAIFGLIHPASVGDPVSSLLQGYIANNGVAYTTFRRLSTGGALVALLLLSNFTPYTGADTTGQSQIAVTRASSTTFAVGQYFHATPSVPIDPVTARAADGNFAALFDHAGLPIV